jgi:hypothetical protein
MKLCGNLRTTSKDTKEGRKAAKSEGLKYHVFSIIFHLSQAFCESIAMLWLYQNLPSLKGMSIYCTVTTTMFLYHGAGILDKGIVINTIELCWEGGFHPLHVTMIIKNGKTLDETVLVIAMEIRTRSSSVAPVPSSDFRTYGINVPEFTCCSVSVFE